MIYRYDSFDNMLRLKNLMDDFFADHPLGNRSRTDFPYVNLSEKNDTIEVEAVIPGVSRDQVNIELLDDSLKIEGERKSDHSANPYIRRERTFGKFKKVIRLPYQVDREKIAASMKDGILKVTLQKSPEAKPKKITVQ